MSEDSGIIYRFPSAGPTWQPGEGVEPIGELHWGERPGGTYEIHLDVAEGHRRKGIGGSMVREAQELVLSRRGVSLFTFMAGDNELAKMFFTRVGFTLIFVPHFYGWDRHAYFAYTPLRRPADDDPPKRLHRKLPPRRQ